MQTDVHIRYQEALNMSHHRRLTIIKTIFTGNCGHPHISFNSDFLHWAYLHRTVLGITCFLGIHRDMVWSALLEHGIVKPQENAFQSCLEEPVVDVPPLEDDELLDPHFTYPIHFCQTSNHQDHSQHQMAPVLDLQFLMLLHTLDPCLAFQMLILMTWSFKFVDIFSVQELAC